MGRSGHWLLWAGVLLLSVALHWQAWGMELRGMHVWRQTQTQQAIDAFVEEDFNILNPRKLDRGAGDGIARFEFPLYQWTVALLAKAVGNSVLLGRIVNFLLGLLGIGGLYAMLRRHGRPMAMAAAYLMAFSPAWFYYTTCPLPDVLVLTLCIWGMHGLMALYDGFTWGTFLRMMACFAAAALVKLPYLIFYVAPAVWWLQQWRHPHPRRLRRQLLTALVPALTLVPIWLWYSLAMQGWGAGGVTQGILDPRVDWGKVPGIAWYYLWQLVPRTLVSVAAVPLVLVGAVAVSRRLRAAPALRPMAWAWAALALAFAAYVVYELPIIGIEHDYYLFPLVPMLALLGGAGAQSLWRSRRWPLRVLVVVLLLAVPLMTWRRIAPRWDVANAELNRDLVTHAAALRAASPDDALVVAGPDVSHNVFLYYLDRKGWSWDENQGLDAEKLGNWRDAGAAYLYCDDRGYDGDPAIRSLLADSIGMYGTIKVWRLR